MTKKPGGQRKSPQQAAGLKEEHQCGGTGSHTGHRYVHILTPRVPAQHRQSTGVCEQAIKPGDFSMMEKFWPRAFKVDRSCTMYESCSGKEKARSRATGVKDYDYKLKTIQAYGDVLGARARQDRM